jgi:TonB-linked SusC/RagA family outer membrane protein
MKLKLNGFLVLLLALVTQITFAQERAVSGTVSDNAGLPLPGVSVLVKGTKTGTQTDFDGKYSIKATSSQTLVFSYIGMKTQEVVASSNAISFKMKDDSQTLNEVVVTALGVSRDAKTLSYASQSIKAAQLNITQDANIKTAIAGKIAGVQIQGQAGAKLGSAGKIRIRGAISLTSDADPLYIIDGVPTDPNNVDMDNIASVDVLKGPNATALYGQRADAGVVIISTKKGSSKGVSVELLSSVTFEKVGKLMNYQNLYGGGYEGEASFGIFGDQAPMSDYPAEWSVFEGKRYLLWDNNYADESWGPKFDGGDYVPWYSWWPSSPYFGKTAKYEAQPNNIRDFYNTGVTTKNGIALSGGNDKFRARFSFTNLDQTGITPYTTLGKQFVSSNFDFNVTDKFNVAVAFNFTNSRVKGDFDDGYSNQTSGSFNSWFNRNLDINKMRELKDLKTPDGYSASWNFWGADYYAAYGGDYKKAAFWYNPYFYMEQYKNIDKTTNYTGSVNLSYKFNDNWELVGGGSRNQDDFKNDYQVPFTLSYSAAPALYNAWSNSFGVYRRNQAENNYTTTLKFKDKFEKFDVDGFVGGNIRINTYDRFAAQMQTDAKTGGLIMPDVFAFANAGIQPTPSTYVSKKEVRSIYAKASVGYENMLYLDASYRKDWSSALPANSNGYGYPSLGSSFIFSELLEDKEILSFGKIRAGWAQVGNDLDAYLIDPSYPLSTKTFRNLPLQYTQTSILDPNIKPAINTSSEFGFDTKFFKNRIGLNFTYYIENRKNEIIPISVSKGSGYDTFLTNAGESERKGVEITFNATPVKTEDFNWDFTFNFGKNKTTVISLPGDLKSLNAPGGADAYGFATVVHELGNEWGQLRGTAIKRDAQGNAVINSNGTYAVNPGQYLGSVLPDFTGGIINSIRYKDFSLNAAIDFQKGGKFFSLSEMWGASSGLTAETAALNDKGINVREAVADGGGVHVKGVDAAGAPVDKYAEGYTYFTQFYGNRLAENYIHNASYMKLRDVSLTYSLPKSLLKNMFSSATISVVGRNLLMIAVAKDNTHNWDPSEMSGSYGESGQLASTKSYGMNIKLTF